MSECGDLNEVLEQGMVDEITFSDSGPRFVVPDADAPIGMIELKRRDYGPIELVSVDPSWRPQSPTLEPVKLKARCKHPVSFTNWQVDGRWCAKCDTRIAPPR